MLVVVHIGLVFVTNELMLHLVELAIGHICICFGLALAGVGSHIVRVG